MTTIWAGLALGSLYVLLALGYNFILIGAGVFNFAQAQMMMVGTYSAWWGANKLGLPLGLVPLVGIVVGFIVGVIVHLVAIKPAISRPGNAVLVTTLGAAIVLDGVATRIFGTNPKGVDFWGTNDPVTILGGRVTPAQLAMIGVAIVGGALFWALRAGTLIGMSAVAGSEDRTAAMLRGINVKRIALLSVGLAGAFAGAIGIVVAQQLQAVPTSGDALAVYAFVVLAIGGMGSGVGAVVGGISVGLIQALTGRYIGGQYVDLVVFGVLLVVLLLRPSGLFVTHRVRTV